MKGRDPFSIVYVDPIVKKKINGVKTAISTRNLKEIGIETENIENSSERKLG
jgi:hypothetical protein